MFVWNGGKRWVLPFNSLLNHLAKLDNLCGTEGLNGIRVAGCTADLAWLLMTSQMIWAFA